MDKLENEMFKYRIGNKSLEENGKITICRCQYGACSPDEALDEIFDIESEIEKISITNVSDEERAVIITIPPRAKLSIDFIKKIRFYLDPQINQSGSVLRPLSYVELLSNGAAEDESGWEW